MVKYKDFLATFGNPIARLEKYMLKKGMIKEDEQQKIREEAKTNAREALKKATKTPLGKLDDLFDCLYDKKMPH